MVDELDEFCPGCGEELGVLECECHPGEYPEPLVNIEDMATMSEILDEAHYQATQNGILNALRGRNQIDTFLVPGKISLMQRMIRVSYEN